MIWRKKAAEAVAMCSEPFHRVAPGLSLLRSDVSLLQWMVGLVLAGVMTIIVKNLF